VSIAAFDALESKKDLWENLLSSLYVVWVVAGIFITLGNTSYFPYAKPIKELSKIHPLLEIRFLLAIILFALSVVHAVNKAFQEKKPAIPLIQKPELRDVSDSVPPIFRPFVQVLQLILDVLLVVGINILNFIWLGIAKFAAYVVRTGKNLGIHFLNLFVNSKLWKSIIRTLFSFVLILSFTEAILPTLPNLIDYYLRGVYPFYSLHGGAFIALVKIGGLVLLTFFCIFFIWSFWQHKKSLAEIRDQGSLGLAFILFAFALSGWVMYGLTHFREFKIIGFSSFGLFSFLSCVFLVAGLLFVIKREIQEVRRAEEPDVIHNSKNAVLRPSENRWVLAVFASLLFIGSVIILFPLLSKVQNEIEDASSTIQIQPQASNIDTSQTSLKAFVALEQPLSVDSVSEHARSVQKFNPRSKANKSKKKEIDTSSVSSSLKTRKAFKDTSSFKIVEVSLDSTTQGKSRKKEVVTSSVNIPTGEEQKFEESKSDSVQKSSILIQKPPDRFL
jgi:hypothetical protein